ncbi:OmpA/MotB family protein [Caproiciproducens sp.]|uniref:OmpA/MotB family protein n=1 Tax=Caproiciproducens sp. TaxID=1954376 RepID=UPI002899EA3D|nr:flagellar motor protein MotB [Caproiciproducens sp.]
MASKKHIGAEGHDEEENSERWLLTYSDMITLLLALFIILYSMSTIDAKKVAKMAENFSTSLNNGTTTSATAGAKTGTGTGSGNGTGTGTGTGNGTGTGTGNGVPMDALDEIYGVLQDYVTKNNLQNQVGLVNTDTYVKIHLKDTLMFVPDSARMLPASEPVLHEIEGALSKVYNRIDYITISGHTADVGEHTIASDQVSWRLSTERALTVMNSFVGYGLTEDKLSIEGFAHFSPIASNQTEAGRAKNRRVEITVVKNPVNKSKNQTK